MGWLKSFFSKNGTPSEAERVLMAIAERTALGQIKWGRGYTDGDYVGRAVNEHGETYSISSEHYVSYDWKWWPYEKRLRVSGKNARVDYPIRSDAAEKLRQEIINQINPTSARRAMIDEILAD